MFGLFNKKGGSRRNRNASKKNKKSRRRRIKGGNPSGSPMMGEKNMGSPNVVSRR